MEKELGNSAEIKLVSPSVVRVIQEGGEVSEDLKKAKIIFFPINNSEQHETAGAGSHWTLLALHKEGKILGGYHYNSLGSSITDNGKKLTDNFRQKLSINEENNLIYPAKNTPQQVNGADCGVYVIAFTRALVKRFREELKNTSKIKDKMKKTIQGQIHPNQEIRKTLEAISRGCQKVYNYFIGERKKCDKSKQKQPSKYEQKRQLKKFKDDNPKLKDIQSQILQEIVRVKVPNAWKKYEEYKRINPKAKYPRTKTDKGAKVKQSERELKIPLELNQPIQGENEVSAKQIKTLTIAWKDQTKMLVSFTCEVEAKSQILLTKIKRMAGIDRNVRKLFANSEGWKYKNPKYWKKVEKKYIELQKSLSRKVKGNVCHKTTRKLVNKNDLLAYEKLEPSEMVQDEKETELKSEKIFECPHCDNFLDRDVNAAKNILWKAQIELDLPTG
ncbi:9952_t:CDS:2 [Gigaspora margarita]|uniref:9952_t:CDS:1 n=1 Tax=Gigaspora margarita TaxID=4874 RepID=A0ABN7WAS1_GIGMA|nr:9952_t:CDS:2 [Gigaspora margarita]